MITDGKIRSFPASRKSKWRPITNLRTVEKNISRFGYSEEYAKDNKFEGDITK